MKTKPLDFDQNLRDGLRSLTSRLKSLRRLPRVVVSTGAGISAESGIKTFRDQNGLWENHRVEDVATPEAFRRNPALVHSFYNERRKQALSCEPNAAHRALVELEDLLGSNFSLVTQNVDPLHEKAGSKRLWHMHGELFKVRCLECEQVYSWQGDLDESHRCQECDGKMRPHIVWFGEVPLRMDEIWALVEQCDVFVAIGTSGQVYPAAAFCEVAMGTGAYTVEINLQSMSGQFDCFLSGPATQSVRAFAEAVRGAVGEDAQA